MTKLPQQKEEEEQQKVIKMELQENSFHIHIFKL